MKQIKQQDAATFWYNFKTRQYDALNESPTDYSEYISQDHSAQALYKLYQEVDGDTPQQAALRVLTLSAGVKGA
jgi:hypothetical protein